MNCVIAALLGGVVASVLYELVFPPVRRRPPALSPEERKMRARGRDRGMLNDDFRAEMEEYRELVRRKDPATMEKRRLAALDGCHKEVPDGPT